MMENISYKNFFKNYGIFLGIVTVILCILIYSVFVSKKTWEKNIKVSIEKVLDDYDSNQWTVGNFQQIKNPMSMSAACYEARSRRTGEVYKAVIIRIETFYGPMPAVYLCDVENNVTFIGFSSLHGRIANIMKNKGPDKRIEYWKKRIPNIIGTDVKQEAN